MSRDSQPTLADLIAALGAEAQVVAGSELLARPVHWVALRPTASDRAIMPGDFAILLPPYATNLNPTLVSLATRGAAGAAVLARAPRGAIHTAASNNLVLV